MKKGEILEKLKDFKDNDEIIFLKKEAHLVSTPEDSQDGDIIYSTRMVQVDDITVICKDQANNNEEKNRKI